MNTQSSTGNPQSGGTYLVAGTMSRPTHRWSRCQNLPRKSRHFHLTTGGVYGKSQSRKIHRYSLEFKRQAVKLSQLEGVEVQAVADATSFSSRNQPYS